MLLHLAEFMEQHDKPLPIDISKLSLLAEKCHSYAKALHYKELEFQTSVTITSCIESLIGIYSNVRACPL